MLEFYHTYNRGVDKRKIFLEERDYLRGVHDLYEFNDTNAVINLDRRCEGCSTSLTSVSDLIKKKPRDKLVSLGVWGFVANHYHLFSSPLQEKGLSVFHKKFGGGFTNFFNIKYQRSGALFQGRYKKVLVDNDIQALHLICYIHANPLDSWKSNWKEKGLTNLEIQNALKFLREKHRWSSHLDWWGIKNFPSLIDVEFMRRFFKNSEEYQKFFIDWLKYYEKNIQNIKKITLE